MTVENTGAAGLRSVPARRRVLVQTDYPLHHFVERCPRPSMSSPASPPCARNSACASWSARGASTGWLWCPSRSPSRREVGIGAPPPAPTILTTSKSPARLLGLVGLPTRLRSRRCRRRGAKHARTAPPTARTDARRLCLSPRRSSAPRSRGTARRSERQDSARAAHSRQSRVRDMRRTAVIATQAGSRRASGNAHRRERPNFPAGSTKGLARAQDAAEV